ncbi:hypothetical protein [Rhodoblastus sp.]|uniref:hypothetical protein n=1 Tax=Rhodoblastus sp. TaxID=1962975 RepID=UPI003F951209
MAYAKVKCEHCGLIMPQNEAIAVEVTDAPISASNDLSFGLSGDRLRLWQQGNRTYFHTRRVFYCPACYENHQNEIERSSAPEPPSQLQVFFKMWLLRTLYKVWRAALFELIGH